jgi:glycosyltransferase involved in cell wall biosynthesis
MKGTSLAKAAAAAAAVEVRFTKSLAGDLSRASALLYLTHSEGLGSGVLLAMAHGLPVIASRTGGLVEAVENEVTGILVDNDVAPAAAALKRLVSDPALAKRLGDAGRRAAGQRFSVDSMVEGTLAVYRKMLG